jgi:hypothetical protein
MSTKLNGKKAKKTNLPPFPNFKKNKKNKLPPYPNFGKKRHSTTFFYVALFYKAILYPQIISV